jgi:Uma2 family endonuclease
VLGLLDAEKPYLEVYDGRGREKVTPDLAHSLAQTELVMAFSRYADACGGLAGIELRFVAAQPSGDTATFLPDVSYYSPDQARGMTERENRYPRTPPYAAVEVRSKSDRPGELDRKIALYLALGSRIVIDVDPRSRTITAADAQNRRTFGTGEVFQHDALPGFSIDLDAFFRRVYRKFP